VTKRRLTDTRIFFPWESHGGVPRWIGFGRLRPIITVGLLLTLVFVVAGRERRRSGIGQTRAMLQRAEQAVEAYRAEHDGGCPPSLQDIAVNIKGQALKPDAWGQPPRIICPSRQDGIGFEVISDGPDRIQGGLDRVE